MGATEAPRVDLEQALRRFGWSAFRPGQREAIETLLQAGRLLLVAPTGGGKSLTYQLPAAALPGTSFVVSPLIALMADQVEALVQRGISATYLSSTLDGEEFRRRLREIREGHHKLVYVSPERLTFPGFRQVVLACRPPLIAVDEAHCISTWGHDFRPEYMRIAELLALSPNAKVLACTATATPVVRDEILARLGLAEDTPQILRGFARPNLALRAQNIRGKASRERAVDGLLRRALGEGGRRQGAAIVYSPTRAQTEEEAQRLARVGFRVDAYHAGLDAEARDRCQQRFMSGDLEVVVATNAFGMGIDRSDVRAVVHLAPPGSIEAYYQEVGRAGRDGALAHGLLLFSAQDFVRRRQMLERDRGDSESARELLAHRWSQFLELMRWAEGGSCRHDAILRYFGDEAEQLSGCGLCDVCQTLQEEGPSEEERTLIVRKALSGVARIHDRFGLGAAVSVLRGVADERVQRAGLQNVSTFGVLKEYPEEWIAAVLRRCVTAGWIDFRGDDRPVAFLTEEGKAVMKGERPVRLLLPSRGPSAGDDDELRPRGASQRSRGGRGALTDDGETLDESSTAIFESLRALRTRLAKQDGVPPYVVASDRTLRDIALLRPRTLDELLLAHGIGPAKADRYGELFLLTVAASG